MKTITLIMAALLSVGTLYAETTETVTLKGTKIKLAGEAVNVGDAAPAVTLVTSELKEITVGGKSAKTQVLVVVPSIDTPVCDMEARTFNEKASKLPGVDITVISMDLPFAGGRYCAAHGIKNITVASDFQSKAFGQAYGTLIGESVLKGIEARVIFIVKDGKVTYKQVVPEITQAPDYDAVLAAL